MFDIVTAQIGDLVSAVDPLEIVGGSILAVVGIVALRMVTAAARHERESSQTLESRLYFRIDQLEEDLSQERKRAGRLIVAYDRERQLRIALEAAGIPENRHPPEIESSSNLISDEDRLDLLEEIEESGRDH